jgi:hypothetical protein
VVHTYNPSYSEGRDQEDQGSKSALGQIVLKIYLKKNPSQKKAGRVAQVVQCLPSKREALSSNHPKKKDPKKINNQRYCQSLIPKDVLTEENTRKLKST